ncbi:MAG TPA: membrane protein insertase YidC [Geobacteraceae bacterium]
MEKRVIIAIVLSIAVLYGYSFLFPPPPKQAPRAGVQGQMSAKGATLTATPAAVTAAAAPQAPAPAATAAASRDITVESDLYTAVFSSRGAALKKFVLKKYRESAGAGGQPISLIAEDAPDNYTLRSEGKAFGIEPGLVYSASADAVRVTDGDAKSLEFTAVANGITYKKTYTFHGNSYSIDLQQQLANTGAEKREGTLQLILKNHVVPKQADNRFETHDAVTFSDNALHANPVKDVVKEAKKYDKGILWTGLADKYFLSSVLAKDASIAQVTIRDANNYLENTIASPAISLNPGQAITVTDKLFFGPKDLDILKAQGNRLEEVIDFGWFSAIAKPLLYTLKFFNRYTHNYGIAIIIITVILKCIFYPLTHKSYKSMKEMQKIQPKMAALKDKFKDDRDGLNRAVMELYKEHKVNPLGGCLPMVVQIPVFFALYKALMFSIDLRQAPFMLWIQDLSAKDPYYVTPIIMGVTMVIQQKMTPNTSMDPTQAKMMMALPVVFTFMFLNFPSGLVLYWLVNNILTIGQQYYINKSIS